MNKKLIGIPTWSTGDNSFGVTKPYLEYWSQFGQVLMLTPGQQLVKELDLLVLPGGLDVLSNNYAEVPSFYAGQANPHLEWFDMFMLPNYIDANIPIFGVCRGMQTLAVNFGCKLIQHIWWDHGYSTNSRESIAHKGLTGTLPDGSKTKVNINSLHHQGVMFDELFPNSLELLIVNGKRVTNKETQEVSYVGDNIVEAFKHKELPIVGVQFHNEHLYDSFSQSWIEYLLNYKKQ
jgi:putative glutamine amidotransferase